jgi:hypothetical protein
LTLSVYSPAAHLKSTPLVTFILRYAVCSRSSACSWFSPRSRSTSPGYYYDEVIFVPVSLRVLGQCDVDAAVTKQVAECFPLMQTLGYVGAVKAWVHAPLFGVFGINRLDRAAAVGLAHGAHDLFSRHVRSGAARHRMGVVAARVARHGSRASSIHARLDWGPQVIAAFMRVLALIALWRWLTTGTKRWLLILCAAFLLGFIDKLNFMWVIGAWIAAASIVCGRLALLRLRAGRPWQPLIRGHHGGASSYGAW